MHNDTPQQQVSFNDLDLPESLTKALNQLGYENPSPIQEKIIPLMLKGRDVIGQAQTGTGKTAAFALPLLARIDLKLIAPQVLVLTPTRELAIQVSEAIYKYASHLKNFYVTPIYGGQDYNAQIKQLRRGVHVVVGTPGRVMDHLRRGTLKLDSIQCLVLDEADEMLNMGFIDDVEWILEQMSGPHQTALFSATMPEQIRKLAKKYLTDPEHITIKVKTTTAETIRQRYWLVEGMHKLDALTRILESEKLEGMIIFVRTKTATIELEEKLKARGHAAAALNGDMGQKQRIRTVERLKSGDLDIVIATDVAARGLDVQRISHVINYDIPHDTEAYVHRIGRTGRAGRSGDAILFVAPRERRMLSEIEKATRQKIELMQLPSTESINNKRIAKFTQRITDTLDKRDLTFFTNLLSQYQKEHNLDTLKIAAALASLLQESSPLLLKPESSKKKYDEKPQGKSRGYDDKPFKKSRDGGDKSFRKSRGDEGRSFRKSGDGEDRPYRKSKSSEDAPYRKSKGSEDRPFRKSRDGDKPFSKGKPKSKASGRNFAEQRIKMKKKKAF